MWINDDGTISGITLLSAKNAKDLKEAFDFGIRNRKVSYTNANDNSSRSHLLFQIQTKWFDKHGTLTCVDLAGTETNQQTGFNLKAKNQALFINESL